MSAGSGSPGRQTISARHPWALLAAAFVAACAGSPARAPDLYLAQRRVEAYIDSGRYQQDFARVVSQARTYLEQRASGPETGIVLDIDETSLSNWPAYRVNGWGRVVTDPATWRRVPADSAPGRGWGSRRRWPRLSALARRARELGVAVFFISGRPPNLREATERNLREQGYQWTGVVLLPEGAKFASAVEFKAPERRRIAEQGYTILLSMGDQQSDLAGGYAERTFKLPNPVYYLP